MDAGILVLTVLSAVLGALAAAAAGAPLPVMLLAYAGCGTLGLLGIATLKVLCVSACETTPGPGRA
jgi:hypothetical protein